MALSFAAGGTQLVNWGFSLGDIATMAGAGRQVGTWLMTHLNDRQLFEWMNVDVDAVFKRKGLVDTAQLQRRWDRRITLLQNGRPTSFETAGLNTAMHRMDRFTWIMTLLTASLDVAVTSTDARQILTRLLLLIFEEQESGRDFVERESPRHIEGWRSASCVRSINHRAGDLWAELGSRMKHPPGYIPSAESGMIVEFLFWLLNGDSKSFGTASTDIFSLAMVLEDLGVLITTREHEQHEVDESQTVVYFSNQVPYSTAYTNANKRPRFGMRIPLTHIEEVGSLFPSDRNQIREIMGEAVKAVKADRLQLVPTYNPRNNLPRVTGSPFREDEEDIMYSLTFASYSTVPRLDGDNYRLVKWFLLQETPAVCSAFLKVIDQIKQLSEGQNKLELLAFCMDNQHQQSARFHGLNPQFDYGDALNYIQAFVLGYWYALLTPLIDSSLLPSESQEAFGAWGWSDVACLDFFRQIVQCRVERKLKDNSRECWLYRHEVLKLVSYLFGGAEIEQLQSARFTALGVLGKLPVLYSSLLGGAVGTFGKFTLLDVDSSCIPSSVSGIVLPGRQKPLDRQVPKSSQAHLASDFDLQSVNTSGQVDFTTHIEPDWDYDAQTCLVTYRYHGRVVHRLNPRQIDVVLAYRRLAGMPATDCQSPSRASSPVEGLHEQDPPNIPSKSYCRVPLEEFFGGVAVHPAVKMVGSNGDDATAYVCQPVVIDTIGLPNAFVCLLCVYQGWKDNNDARLCLVQSQQDFDDAIRTTGRLLILYR